jgi:hypothetical protein
MCSMFANFKDFILIQDLIYLVKNVYCVNNCLNIFFDFCQFLFFFFLKINVRMQILQKELNTPDISKLFQKLKHWSDGHVDIGMPASTLSMYFERICPSKLPDRCRWHGCQMVYFLTKNPILGIFWRALEWKMGLHFIVIWKILQTFGIFNWQLVSL